MIRSLSGTLAARRRRRTTAPINYDTTTYNAATGEGIGGAIGIPIGKCWDAASLYNSDAQFRTQIAYFNTDPSTGRPTWILSDQSKNGTGTYNNGNPALSTKYDDGRYVDLALWQNLVQYLGQPAIECTLPGQNLASPTPTPQLQTIVPSTVYRTWLWTRRRYQAGFTVVGDADDTNCGRTYNIGGTCSSTPYAGVNAALKIAPWAVYSSGRGGATTGNGSGNTAQINLENGIGSVGLTESDTGARIGTEWTDATWYDYAIECDQVVGVNGNVWFGATMHRRKQGDAYYTRLGKRLYADSLQTLLTAVFEFLGPTTANMNQSFLSTQKYWWWGWAAFDASVYADPYRIHAHEYTLQPENPGTDLAKTAQSGTSVTFSCTVNRFTKYLRVVIDGVPDTTQDVALPAETSDGSTASATFTIPTGTHTITLRALNGNKTLAAAADTNSVTLVSGTAQLFLDVTSLSLAVAGTHQFTAKYGVDWASGTDVTSSTTFTIDDTTVATIDAPTFSSISPSTITQGDTNVTYTITGTNLKTGQTLTGLPSGVTASSLTAAGDGLSATATLSATGGATTGGAPIKVHDASRGDSGTKTLTVNSGATSGGLTIPGGDRTLVYYGTEQLVVLDDSNNPVSGCTMVISDGTKGADHGSYNLFGLGKSGTFQVYFTHSTYTNSAPITITCRPSIVLDPAVGLSKTGGGALSDGDAVTGWTDSNGNAFTLTGTYKASGINGKPAVTFNGTSNNVLSPSTTDYNGSTIYEALLIKTSSDGGSSSRNLVSTLVNANLKGYNFALNTSNFLRGTTGTGSGTSAIGGTGPDTVLSSARAAVTLKCSNGSQALFKNGTAEGTSTSTFAANTVAVQHRLMSSNDGTGNYTGGDLYLRIYVSSPSSSDYAQVDRTMANA